VALTGKYNKDMIQSLFLTNQKQLTFSKKEEGFFG
jgi:hypothetical protein